jgi:VWFA-related protein
MPWQDLVYAREQLIRFLRQVHPEDRLGIYLMGEDRFWVLHEYTQSCTDLLDRLASWKGNAGPEPVGAKYRDVWTEFAVRLAGVDAETARAIHRSQFWGVNAARSSALPDNLQEAPGNQNGNLSQGGMISVPGTYLVSDERSPLAVLWAVARHLAQVPGRKNVILISGKMFLPTESRQDQIQVLRAIVQTGVAIYTIDPGGLAPYDLDASFVIPSWVTANAPNPTRAALEYIGRAYDWKRQLILYLQSSLTALAEATGGQVFVNTNDVLGAIRSSFDDSRVTYTLGFYPSASNDDGSFHPLKVKLPGRRLTVRYRAGYFEPAAPARDPLRREAELRQAVWSPVDASAIELSGTASPATGSHDYELKLSIGLAAVSLQPDGDRWSGQIEVILVQRDNFGNEYEPLSQELGLKLKQESYDQAVRSGLPYDRSFRLNPKATSLRAVVRDLNSGNLGTLTIPLPASAP